MQEPTEDDDDEASVSTENETEDPDENLNRTFAVRRKAAKRTLPWFLPSDELELVSPSQAEDIRATKKPRLEEPISASTDETTANIAPAATVADHVDADPVKGAPASSYWSPEEDAKLKSAVVAKTCQSKCGKQYIKDWVPIAALFPYRTKVQCSSRWYSVLNRNNIDPTTARTGKWSEEELIRLKDAVLTHGSKNWNEIAALVPGRTRVQCSCRWNNVLVSTIDLASGRTGKWSEDELITLKDAVETHGGKNWGAIAALVPGRTIVQCSSRWKNVLVSDIDQASGRTGNWSEEELITLKDAVQTHGGKNWGAIAAMVPDRSINQCSATWHNTFASSIDPKTARAGRWLANEDIMLMDAVQTHGGKNWGAIAALVPGRTEKQCNRRWNNVLHPSIDRATERTSVKWTADELIMLKDAVQTHGGKNWSAIGALVPGRTLLQCKSRWYTTLISNIDPNTARAGRWLANEDSMLKDAVQTHGDKNWGAIAALVPSRTEKQCTRRWRDVLDPSIDRTTKLPVYWAEDEDTKLKDAVLTHGDKGWNEIAALVPGRTKSQCRSRWQVLRRTLKQE
jgi:hypothetical protein